MTLYRLSKDELLARLNERRKTALSEEDIFGGEIKISLLKKIDSLFKKGISYYVDPKNPTTDSREESIFFRKEAFNAELNLGSKQIVNKFEEQKIEFSSLAKLSDFKLDRILPKFKISDNPKQVGLEIREKLSPPFAVEQREFLKSLISTFAEFNILVFEFVETHNKKEKANINGFYLAPNVIVLKRNQKALKREIFTLAHELGHYLLSEEEIDDQIHENDSNYNQLNSIERWCNDFAFYFLIGDYSQEFTALSLATGENHFYETEIRSLSRKTLLSSLALYTRLLLDRKITPFDYKKKKEEIVASIRERENREKEQRELDKQRAAEQGIQLGGSTPKAIISPLYLKTLQNALYYGLINEVQFCTKLSIKPDKLEKYLL